MAEDIISLFPPHKLYVEVFGGAAHVLFKKIPSAIEVYNDINQGLYLFFSVLRDEIKWKKFQEKLVFTSYSRQEFDNAKNWDIEEDEIEKVRKFYVRSMQAVDGNGGWGYTKSVSRRGMSKEVSQWLGHIDENLPMAVERLREVQVENLDFKDCIKKYDGLDTLFYLDPPYIHETRRSSKGYAHEMTEFSHQELVILLRSVIGKVILSGYDNPIYCDLEKSCWTKISLANHTIMHKNSDGVIEMPDKEFVWINFNL